MTLYPIQDAFVRGEISPRLHSRASLELYRGALARCENFLTLPHGGIRKRGGTYFVSQTKYDAPSKVRLIPFQFSAEQAYCLEFGEGYFRVHAYGAYLGIEVATPWTASHLDRLQFVQSADVMWVVHPDITPRKITRVDASTFTVEEVPFVDGPFGAINTDESKTVYASNVTGAVTLTANTGIFSVSDVGRLIRIEMESYGDIVPWAPDTLFVSNGVELLNKQARYDGNVYRSVTSGSTAAAGGWRFGSTPPTHLKGVERDGPLVSVPDEYVSGVEWEYLHSGFGVARITGFTSSTVVSAEVLSRFPDEVVGSGNAAYQYSFGAFSPGNYPVAVALFEERLFFANKLSVFGSKTGDFESFRIGAADDDALEFLLAANEANDIVWLADADGFLAIGTIGGVRALAGSGIDEALTPSSFKNRSSSTLRCSRLRPLNTGQAFLYVANGNRAVAEMVSSQGRFESGDASQVSEHIFKKNDGITENAYQESPDPIAWYATTAGQLVGFTYQRDQEVRGFHRQVASNGGTFTSVCVTPGLAGADDVWVVSRRLINGSLKQYVELLQQPFEYIDKAAVFNVDCGLSYIGETAVSTVSGLAHLEGETVAALADGYRYDDLTVTDGEIVLPDGRMANVIHVGIPYEAAAETLELDVGARDGSLTGRRKRIAKLILSVLETDLSGLEVQSLQKGRWEQVKVHSIASNDGTIQLETRSNIEVPIDDSWEGQACVRIRHVGPGPCTIRSVVAAFDNEP